MRNWIAFLCLGPLAGADLFSLVRQNDLAGIQAELKKGADVNAKDRRGATPLMHAAAFGTLDAMKLLIDAGASVNARNAFDATALIWAAGDAAKVKLLLDSGADVKAVTKQRRTALIAASVHDPAGESVRLLLAKGADPRGGDGSAAVMASNGHDTAAMIALLEKGADPNATGTDGFGFTPLMSAVSMNNPAAVKLILAKGAKADQATSGSLMVKKGKIALDKLTPLMLAAPYASAEMVKALLDAGAQVDARDIRGMTPLMLAVASETQDVEVMKLLLAKGADVNAKSDVGETPLDWARKFNNAAMIRALEGAGAKPGVPYTAPARAAGTANARTSVEKSVALLQKASTRFFLESGCVGCHHQNFTAMAVAAARSRGVPLDEATAAEQLKVVRGQWNGAQEILLQMIDPPGAFDTVVFSVLGMAAARYPADVITDSMVHYIAGQQRANGSWSLLGISRAPLEEGNIQRTALGVRALQAYGWPGRKAEFDRRTARARAFLLAETPKTTDDFAMRLLGLHWSGADAARIRDAAAKLRALQRSDGGWGQNANLASDAYATGESLWALHESGLGKPRDAVYQRGVKFLLSTQYPDGSWYVRSRSPKFQPYFESGFPFGHDQWISAAGTAWAAMALAPVVESVTAAVR